MHVGLLEEKPKESHLLQWSKTYIKTNKELLEKVLKDSQRIIGRSNQATPTRNSSNADRHSMGSTPDIVFVFPHPNYIEKRGKQPMHRRFVEFKARVLKCIGWLHSKEPWREFEDWQCLIRTGHRSLHELHETDETRQDLEKIKELEDFNKKLGEKAERLKELDNSGHLDQDGSSAYKIVLEAGIELLVCKLQELNKFKVDYYMFGDSRLAIFATWNDDDLLSYAEKKSICVRLDTKKLFGRSYKCDGIACLRGALVPYSKAVSKYARDHSDDCLEQDGIIATGSCIKAMPQECGRRLFVSKVRSLLAYSFISELFDLHAWKRLGIVKAWYLPHDKKALDRLFDAHKLTCSLCLAPHRDNLLDIHQIHEYFGSQIAYYFAFAQFTCKFAGVVLIVTVLSSCVRYVFFSSERKVDIGFIMHGLWASFTGVLFVKFWARERNRWSASWEHRKASIDEVSRPDFKGVINDSPVDPRHKVMAPVRWKQFCGRCGGWFLTALFSIFIIMCDHWHFDQRVLHHVKHKTFAMRMFFDMWLAAQVKIFRVIWEMLAPRITAMEHHQYEHTFDESLESHLFVVFMVNSMYPFVHFAFFQLFACPETARDAGYEDKCREECWNTLTSAFRMLIFGELATILPVVLGPVLHFSSRLASAKGVWKRDSTNSNDYSWVRASFLEYQYLVPDYTGVTLSYDYQQLLIPLCYLFVFAQVTWPLPAAPICLWMIAIVQRSLNYWKLLRLYRRPIPTQLTDIGKNRLVWLKFFAYFSAMTNWALVSFYCKPFIWLNLRKQLDVFLCGTMIVGAVAYIMESNLILSSKDDVAIFTRMRFEYQRNVLQQILAEASSPAHNEGQHDNQQLPLQAQLQQKLCATEKHFEPNPFDNDQVALEKTKSSELAENTAPTDSREKNESPRARLAGFRSGRGATSESSPCKACCSIS